MINSSTFHIPIPKNFSFLEVISFLDRGYDDCLYKLTNNTVSRLIDFDGDTGLLYIQQQDTNIEIQLIKNDITQSNIEFAKSFVSHWFDMDRDIEPFYNLLNNHPTISYFTKQYAGSRLIGIPSLFEALCWAIIGQQINLTFAYKLKRLLVEKHGSSKSIDGQQYYLFPTPDIIKSIAREELVIMKFSRQKIDYLYNISEAFLSGKINKSELSKCKGKTEMINLLTSIKGIGKWTANYALMKSIRDPNCITYGDSGLNKAIHLLFKTDKKPSIDVVDDIFSEFKGWESYLNFYLWKSLAK